MTYQIEGRSVRIGVANGKATTNTVECLDEAFNEERGADGAECRPAYFGHFLLIAPLRQPRYMRQYRPLAGCWQQVARLEDEKGPHEQHLADKVERGQMECEPRACL